MNDRLNSYQLADRLGVSLSTIVRWRYEKRLPAPRKENGRVFWPIEQIEAWESEGSPCLNPKEPKVYR